MLGASKDRLRFSQKLATICAATLLWASAGAASTTEIVTDRLAAAGWDTRAIDSVLSVHAEEFDLDAISGWLDQRLQLLARLGRYSAALRMIEEYPEYSDLFTNAPEPDVLARVIRELAVDRQDAERLLNLFIGWPSSSEIAHLQRVLDRHGSTVMMFVGSVHLHPVAEALVLSHAEQAPVAWNDWLASEFRAQAREGRIEEFIVTVETQGRALARRMESTPGFVGEFPILWRQFRELVEARPTEETRHQMLTGLLSHEGVWETLAEPFGAKALGQSEDWAPVVLLTLWGTEGWTQPLEASAPLLEPRPPIPAERRAWLLRELASDSFTMQSLAKIGIILHDVDAFWAIALDPARTDLLTCAWNKAQQRSGWNGAEAVPTELISQFDALAVLTARGLRRMCREEPSIFIKAMPGYQGIRVIGNLIEGAPIDPWDVVAFGTEFYVFARYAGLISRGMRFARPQALGLGPRMSLDYLHTQREALALGQQNAVAPRLIAGRMRDFVLVRGGSLAPVPRMMSRGGQFMSRETLQNLAAEGILTSDFSRRVIRHFRCAGPMSEEDPGCH